MLSQVIFNRDKWMAAIMLDPVTGIDPPGVKVRAAEGLDAASSFIQGYWIWSVNSQHTFCTLTFSSKVEGHRKPRSSQLRYKQHVVGRL